MPAANGTTGSEGVFGRHPGSHHPAGTYSQIGISISDPAATTATAKRPMSAASQARQRKEIRDKSELA
jgi:hypothetical protein